MCRACVELLPITGASISLTAGSSARALWCAGDDTASRLAEAQDTLGDGPCQTAINRATPVLAGDLTHGSDARRRPLFAHQAVELGVRAVFSLPLGASVLTVGTLDLRGRTLRCHSISSVPGFPGDRADLYRRRRHGHRGPVSASTPAA